MELKSYNCKMVNIFVLFKSHLYGIEIDNISTSNCRWYV